MVPNELGIALKLSYEHFTGKGKKYIKLKKRMIQVLRAYPGHTKIRIQNQQNTVGPKQQYLFYYGMF